MKKIRCGRGHYHNSIIEVRACYNGERVEDVSAQVAPSGPAVTPRQLDFIEALLAKAGLEYAPGLDTLDRRSASAVIAQLKDGSAAKRSSFTICTGTEKSHSSSQEAAAFDTESLEDGFYALPGPTGANLPVVCKVVIAVHGSGRKYAKRLNTNTGEWQMARGGISLLRPEHKMTLEQALKVAKVVATDVNGALYGRCFSCGRPLTAEDSIERMMGPICAGNFS